MAQSFFPTALTIIDAALRAIRGKDSDIASSTQQRTDALEALNFLVTSWQAKGMQVWCQKQGTHTLTASTNSYTVGSGGDINQQRPLSIQMAWLRDTSGKDNPMRIGGREEYNSFTDKTTPGVPVFLYYDPQYDLPGTNSGATAKGKIFLWPTPDATTVATYDLYFIYTRPIQDFASSSDNLDFPQEWYNAVKWNLAVEIMPEYGLPVMEQDRIRGQAKAALELVEGWDREEGSMYIQPAQGDY